VLLLVALCVALAAAQQEFSGTFELRHPFMTSGVVQGEVQYSWSTRSYRFFYPTASYQEIYSFNPARGYASLAVTDRPFANQFVYKSGRTCACETGPMNAAMAQLFVDPAVTSEYTVAGNTRVINGVTCAEYRRNAGSAGDVTALWWDAAGRKVCRAVFSDLREMTFRTITNGAPARTIFNPPAGCKCGTPIDIALVLDRSGSISQTEFVGQKAFVVGFSQAFAYGPLGANLALVHFNTPAWTTLTMTEGVSDANVNASVNALVCCTKSTDMADSCCCCGTAISTGMRLGTEQLKLGRARTEKVLITLTDGYHNHDIHGNDCSNNPTVCRQDLIDTVTWIKGEIPEIKMYSIGVGADRDVSADELLIIADNKPERLMRFTDFDGLAQGALDLVGRACQENINPCGGCCGFCVCGQCTPPDACDSSSFCSPSNVSGVCCKSAPRNCANPNNLCAQYSCDEAQAACLSTPVSCKANVTCFNYACQAATGLCATTPLCGQTGECTLDAECDDGNFCTRDTCDRANSACRWENIAGTCDDGDACTVDQCDVTSGCTHAPVPTNFCDDQSVCTNDVCDRALGCVHTNITCTDDNLCTDDICDPFRGCLSVPMNCSNTGKDKCKLFFCANGTCVSRDADGCAVPIVTVAAVLSTAAIIGVVIGVVLCVAGVGAGGAFAYSQAAGTGNVAPVANNPLYAGNQNQGMNPLYNRGS